MVILPLLSRDRDSRCGLNLFNEATFILSGIKLEMPKTARMSSQNRSEMNAALDGRVCLFLAGFLVTIPACLW